MVSVMEFKNVNDINEYFSKNRMMKQFEVIPIERRFTNPNNKLITSCITYILVMND